MLDTKIVFLKVLIVKKFWGNTFSYLAEYLLIRATLGDIPVVRVVDRFS